VKAAVLTVSDGVEAGTREDRSGDTLERLLMEEGFLVERRVVADEAAVIAAAIADLADRSAVVLTTGGTGFTPRDVTPEATRTVLDREAPGIAEAIRADALRRTPHALLSRGLAGLRGPTLIVNLPGSPGGCRDGFAVHIGACRGVTNPVGTDRRRHRRISADERRRIYSTTGCVRSRDPFWDSLKIGVIPRDGRSGVVFQCDFNHDSR